MVPYIDIFLIYGIWNYRPQLRMFRIFQVNDWIFLDPDSGIWWYKLSSKLYIKKKQIQWLINTVPHLSIKPYIPTRVTNCIFLKLSPTTFFWVKYKALCTQICRFASRNLWQVEVKPPSPPFEVPFEVGFWMGTFVTGTFNRTHFKGNQTSSTCMVVFKVPFPPAKMDGHGVMIISWGRCFGGCSTKVLLQLHEQRLTRTIEDRCQRWWACPGPGDDRDYRSLIAWTRHMWNYNRQTTNSKQEE